jgi:putative glutamine amidotransferase
MRPVIGLTAGESLFNQSDEGAPRRAHAALRQDYLSAVDQAGGAPLLLPIEAGAHAASIVGRLDGLILTGGNDVAPGHYGESPLNDAVQPNPMRDDAEMTLLQTAHVVDLPVLAICRGMQVLNVTRGGTLFQDLPVQWPEGLPHQQEGRPDATGHDVSVDPGSRLRAIVRTEVLRTNSFHHQAVRETGRNLRVSARGEDGLIEALEDPTRRFLLGVQWHPEELLSEPRHLALFQALVEAARAPREPRVQYFLAAEVAELVDALA